MCQSNSEAQAIAAPWQLDISSNGVDIYAEGFEQTIARLEFREGSGREYSDLTDEQVVANATRIVRAVNAYGYLKQLLIDRGFSDERLETLISKAEGK